MPLSQPIYDDMFVPLLVACPSYKARWVRLLSAHWGDAHIPLYIAMHDYCEHIVSLLSAGQQQQLMNVFEAIEQLLTDSEDYVQTAAVVGMLESLQNAALHGATTLPEQLYPLLGETCEVVWDELWAATVIRLAQEG